jgi:ferrous iron transport protein B
MFVWAAVVGITFITAGTLVARLIPGDRPVFYLELPPLRLPNATNVLTKAYTRMHWYLLEVLPLFVAASVLIWLGNMTGGFAWIMHMLHPVMQALGLPPEAARIFVFGFFRRDYGAAGLYDVLQTGSMGVQQQLVAATILTLFIPCIAQLSVMVKERGWLATLSMAGFIFPFAFLAGYTVHRLLTMFKVIFQN